MVDNGTNKIRLARLRVTPGVPIVTETTYSKSFCTLHDRRFSLSRNHSSDRLNESAGTSDSSPSAAVGLRNTLPFLPTSALVL